MYGETFYGRHTAQHLDTVYVVIELERLCVWTGSMSIITCLDA